MIEPWVHMATVVEQNQLVFKLRMDKSLETEFGSLHCVYVHQDKCPWMQTHDRVEVRWGEGHRIFVRKADGINFQEGF